MSDIKFKSNYFKDVTGLCAALTTLEQDYQTRRKRREIIRSFTNGLATMTEEDAKEKGMTEIVNHLTSFKFLYQRKKRLEQSYTSTRAFVEIIVDTDNPEYDILASTRLTTIFNRGCLYSRGSEFRPFLRACAGEIQISGGMPVTHHKQGSWVPKMALNMLFPKKCGLTASEIPYAFGPEEMSLGDLEGLRDAIKNSSSASKKAVEDLIASLKKKPSGTTPENASFALDKHSKEKIGSSLEESDSDRNATIPAWWYYELKYSDDGTQYVSGTFFTRGIQSTEDQKSDPQIIAYFDKLYNRPDDWLHLVCMDMEIGGDTTWESVRGLAEIMYPSASEIEILLNLILTGDKERARPKYQITSSAVADDILAWDPEVSSIVPNGIAPFDVKGSSASLLTPYQMLMGNIAGMSSGGEVANVRGEGELRAQTIGRQREQTVMQFGDMSDWAVNMEDIMTTSVERAFVGEIRKNCRGHQQMMYVRKCAEEYNLPLTRLFKREHGQLKYIRVKVHRVLGEGDMASEKSASAFLLSLYPKIAPQNRSKILQRAIAVETQDPDLAEDLVKIPQPVINAQKLTAENECDTIMRRALLGQAITTNVDDVDMDHIPVHMMDMLALVSLHQLQPWTKLQVIQFAALQRHTQDHFENVLGDKDVRDEALAILPQFQQIVQAAQALVALVEQQQGQADQGMTEKERAELELKAMAEHRKGVELGIKIENNQSLEKQRAARQATVNRTNYLREIQMAAQTAMQRERERVTNNKTQTETALMLQRGTQQTQGGG